MRRSFTYALIGLTLMSRHAGQTRNEAGQFDEVCEAQERTPIADGDLRIRGDLVRPLRWN
jgi:hypothetical protein